MTASKKTTASKPAPSSHFQGSLNLWVTILLALAIVVMVNYLNYRYYTRRDYSLNRFYELSPKTVSVLKSLPGPVTIINYTKSSAVAKEIEGLIQEYQRYGGKNIVVEAVDPDLDLQRARELAAKYKFGSGESLVIFEYQDRNKYLREGQLVEYEEANAMSGQAPAIASFKGEQQFTATLQALVEGKPAKIYYVTGHGEPPLADLEAPAGIGQLANRIRRENTELEALNLAQTPAVPEDADAVLLISPRTALPMPEAQAIADYLDKRKGKLVTAIDPGVTSGAEAALAKYGIRLDNDRLLARIRVMGVERPIATVLVAQFPNHPVTTSLNGYNLQLPDMRSLTLPAENAPEASKVRALLNSPKGYWGETNLTDKNPQPGASEASKVFCVMAVYDAGELPGEGVKLAGTRLAVFGGGTFLLNGHLDTTGVDLFINTLNWMLKKETAIGIGPKTAKEFALSLGPAEARLISWLAVGLAPGVALIFGIAMWYARRR